MLTHLIASQGPSEKRRFFTPGTMSVSLIVHAGLLAGLAVVSVAAPKPVGEKVEQVTFVEVQKEPEAPKPDAPPPPPPEVKAAAPPPVPKGFQQLVPPEEPPAEIPEVDTSAPAVTAADFSGLGVAGGRADGDATVKEVPKEPPPEEPAYAFAYEVAVLDSPPKLSNTAQVQATLERLYPRLLLDGGIEGMVVMQFVITEEGDVDVSTAKVISASHEQFAAASEKALERFRFRPGKYKGKNVRVLIQMPITWKPQR